MASQQRWTKAQEYERSYWKKVAYKIASGEPERLGWYGWRVDQLETRIAQYLNQTWKQSAKVLEIGCGPVGMISSLKCAERYAIDPLDDFYRSDSRLSHLRDPAVSYRKGQGEELPFDNETFSLIVIENVLDHVQDPKRVLGEIHRTLKDDGLLYATVNVHTPWGAFMHAVLSTLLLDQGHPHTFTTKSMRNVLQQTRFDLVSEWNQEYSQAREKDRQSVSFKAKIKGYSGLSEFDYGSVCKKRV